MNANGNLVATIKAGSSSLRFALCEMGKEITRKFVGKFERIGSAGAGLTTEDFSNNEKTRKAITMADHVESIPILVEWLEKAIPIGAVAGIGHRIVHGGPRYFEPQQVDGAMLKELRRLSPADPTHLPAEISVIENLAERYPKTPQFACFDTAFHRSMPRVARLLPIPRRYFGQGVQRYGFHGLSYSCQVGELERIEGAPIKGRIILAHLGSGASLAAVRDGKCIDTTMAFTPAAGLMMSARSGDIDPGLPAYFARTERMNAEQFDRMINAESGLLGVSETSPDVRDLLEKENSDARAAEALALFCYQVKKWIGALSAALGGLDMLVFSGGIGQNSAAIRERISEGLGYLGVELNRVLNTAHEPVISEEGSKVTVRVIRTDEELYLAQSVWALIGRESRSESVEQNKPAYA